MTFYTYDRKKLKNYKFVLKKLLIVTTFRLINLKNLQYLKFAILYKKILKILLVNKV